MSGISPAARIACGGLVLAHLAAHGMRPYRRPRLVERQQRRTHAELFGDLTYAGAPCYRLARYKVPLLTGRVVVLV